MKPLTLLCILFISINTFNQSKTAFSLQQDVRLLFFGDTKGNNALTLNLLSKLETPIVTFNSSYMVAHATVEYADLKGKNYQRYAAGFGYVLQQILKNFDAGAYIDFGKIYRNKDGFFSYSASGEIAYQLTQKIKLIATQQVTYRKDLLSMYNANKSYVVSGFVGIKYYL